MKACDYCEWGAGTNESTGGGSREKLMLCDLCFRTYAGNMAHYPQQHDTSTHYLMKSMIMLEWMRRGVEPVDDDD